MGRSRRGIRLRRWWARNGWRVLAGLLAGAFVLGCIGFDRVQSRPLVDLFYASGQLIVFQAGSVPHPVPLELEIARFASPLFAALLGVGGLVALLRRHEWKAARMRDHTIVCGIGSRGSSLATEFQERRQPVIGVTKDDGGGDVLKCRDRGIPIRIGDAGDPDVLVAAGVDRARRVIAASGDDSVNAEIAVALRTLKSEGYPMHREFSAWIHIVDPELEGLLSPLLQPWMKTFNVYREGAEAMLHEHLAPALDGQTGARVLVVGLGKLGQSVALRARHDPYARALGEVLAVDENAREKVNELRTRDPDAAAAVRLTPYELDVRGADFEAGTFLEHDQLACAFVCLDDESLALTTGLTLLRRLGPGVAVVVRVTGYRRSLADLIDHDTAGRYGNLRTFRLLKSACTPDYFA
jgi:hypothetical protein